MFSIYSIAFNVVKNNFAYEEAIENFCAFAEEVVVAVNKSDDNTWDEFKCLDEKYTNLKIIPATVDLDDPRLDGKLFNLALQATTQEFKILGGLDHRFCLYQKPQWEQAAYQLRFSELDALLIPVLDLWGDERSVRWDNESNVQTMWFLHKDGLHRGVASQARLEDGGYDPTKCDSSSLIHQDGTVAKAQVYLDGPVQNLQDYLSILSKQNLFVYHTGYANFDNRIKVNKDVWQKQWEEIRPKEKKENLVAVTTEELQKHKTYKHNLKLWNE